MKLIIAISLVILSLDSFAKLRFNNEKFKSMNIKLESQTDDSVYNEIRFDADGKTCKAVKRKLDLEKSFTNINSKDCKKLLDSFKSKIFDFENLAQEINSNVFLQYQNLTGVLTIGNLAIPVNLQINDICDASFKNCTKPNLNIPSAFAKDVRTIVTKNLGR